MINRYQAARQQRYDQAYAAGYAAGEARQGRLGYAQGHEDGLAEGRAQAGRELTISTEKAYSRGYECGQLDLLSTLEQADQARGTGPTMSA